ncbi:hypothetical protein BGZ94_003885, partial [Podila epigama]
MDPPCSKVPPKVPSVGSDIEDEEFDDLEETASEDYTLEDPEAKDDDEADIDAEEETDIDADEEADADSDEDTNADDAESVNLTRKKKHHRHRHHGHHKGKHQHGHHKGKHHHHRKGKHHRGHHKHKNPHHRNHHHKRPHPWEDRCVAIGEFCGSQLFGCNFDAKTRYSCKAIGEKPVIIQRDAKECGGSNGGKCSCTSNALVCGSQIPAECKADPQVVYRCNKGKYEVFKICDPGTICRTNSANEPICGYSTCECSGSQNVCSDQFPEKCELKKNSIYKCSASGKPELVKACDDKLCVAVADGAMCLSRDCKCPVNGSVCGVIFPAFCRIPATGLYNCRAGQDPVLIRNCLPNRCTTTIAAAAASGVFDGIVANDVCVDPCKCVSKGKVCGSTFIASCGLEKNSLYKCDEAGSTPVKLETCDKECLVHGGDDACSDTSNCKCPISASGKPVCGGKLDPSCNADPTAIYHCPDGDGSKPQILKKCLPGTHCDTDINNDPYCGYRTCECSNNVEVCSNQIPHNCKLVPNSIYKCNSKGTLDLVKTCDNPTQCVSTIDGAMCSSCKCPRDGLVCGDVFPIACRLSASTIYQCKKGDDPIIHKTCEPGTCSSSIAVFKAQEAFFKALYDDQCVDNCKCVTTGKVCGSTVSPVCKLKPNTIYRCDGAGKDFIPIEDCPNECISQAGAAICTPVKPDCTCKKAYDTCGSAFDPACNLEANKIYKCSGSGATPVPDKTCEKGCVDNGAGKADTCNATPPVPDCTCKKAFDTCGHTFDPACKLDASKIYKCSGSGAIPIPDGTCANGCADNGAGKHDACKVDCTCKKAFDTCGSTFDKTCGLSPTMLYKCTGNGAAPTPGSECKNGCADNGASKPDTCKDTPPDCTCKKAFDTCGSTFDPACKLDASKIYKCSGSGANPVPDKTCDKGCVDNGAGKADTCKVDCTCKKTFDTCGSTFDPSCKLDAKKLYKCISNGSDPIALQDCTNGCDDNGAGKHDTCKIDCTCKKAFDTCGSTFDPSCKLDASKIYKCSGSGATPVPDKACEKGCVDNGAGKADTCKVDCTCKKAFDTCGSSFDPACKLDASKIYKCSGSGETPVPDKTCDKGCVDNGAGKADTCKADCTCKKTFDTCGSTFDPSCKLDSKKLYKCISTGSDPIALEDCANGCVDNGATKADTCKPTPPDCTCKKSFDTCGSTFDPDCKLDANKIYKCSGSGATPVPDKACAKGCVDNGAGKADTCKVDCTCKKAFDTCGASFDPECKLDASKIYKCSGSGANPVPDKTCEKGCVDNGAGKADTCKADCTCKKPYDTCGSSFDPSCGLSPTTLYKCNNNGAKPSPSTECKNGCVDNGAAKADTCNDTPPDCTCKKAFDTCGSSFDPACKLDASKTYKCS